MACTLSNKCAKNLSKRDSSTSTYHQKRGHMFFGTQCRMIGLPYGEKNCDDMLSHFHLIPEHHGQTD